MCRLKSDCLSCSLGLRVYSLEVVLQEDGRNRCICVLRPVVAPGPRARDSRHVDAVLRNLLRVVAWFGTVVVGQRGSETSDGTRIRRGRI